MREPAVRIIGGPFDTGTPDGWTADVVEIAGHPGMAYHRTRRHVSGSLDPDWFMKNVPEPVFERVYEWHERDWESPAVRAIKDAVTEASERVFGG